MLVIQLVIDKKTYKLNLLPSGIIRGKKCIIGNGVVLDPFALIEEIKNLKSQGLIINNKNLIIAEKYMFNLTYTQSY